jgi:DNA-binding NarL/FixJ family response regulator
MNRARFSPEHPVRVVIADSHPIFRKGIRHVVEKDGRIRVVGEVGTGNRVLQTVLETEPDVLLLDVNMLNGSGMGVVEHIKRQNTSLRILILSGNDNRGYVADLMNSGVEGYLTKDKSPSLIVETVLALAQGETRWFAQAEPSQLRSDELTDREREVLCLMGSGKSNTEIAETLVVSDNTVRTHLSRIYRKLGVHSGRAAVAYAWKNGLMRQQ